jgi:hypothetical protein
LDQIDSCGLLELHGVLSITPAGLTHGGPACNSGPSMAVA